MLADTSLFLAIIFAAEIARRRIRGLFRSSPPEMRERAAFLERALPNNVTVEMGLALDRLAHFEEIATCPSGAQFADRLHAREFTPEFLEAWDETMARHGFRCPMEMDPATPRPYEQPAALFERLRAMAGNAGASLSAHASHEQVVAKRELAHAELLQVTRHRGRRRARRLESSYRILVELGGLRETPKYCAVLATDLFRRQVLQVGQALVEAGRLDGVQQAFDLTVDELDRALADPALDLRALAEENTRFLRKLARVREFPRLIDSRGKILHPPLKPAAAGELAGEPISPGIARGPVRVLHSPDEKPLQPGGILVTQATDPGWTPLFLKVAGVILEVGGLLQHGALVAREYGKPCVAGIEHVTGLLQDGQLVELDGTSGIVRLSSGAEAK
jgi:phosphohistidine swiveling domain-containing protein